MSSKPKGIAGAGMDVWRGWDQFWFAESQPHTLAAVRILAGAMLFYTHFIWTWGLDEFLGPQGWVPPRMMRELVAERGTYAWSHLWWIESPGLLWAVHLAALLTFALLTVGYFTRIAAVFAWLFTLAYCHRMHGTLFGLDQVNVMLSMYLMLGPCGDVYSIDAWLLRRRGKQPPEPLPSRWVTVAIRLMQVHLCIVYLFGGVNKMKGATWWNGLAFWYSIANYEYQSVDMTWMATMPVWINVLTHITLFWETFYCALIWPRVTRPLMLAIAVAVHGGIAVFLGMPTFGTAMLIANLAFVEPQTVRAVVNRLTPRWATSPAGSSLSVGNARPAPAQASSRGDI